MEELRKQLFNLAIVHGLKSCFAVLDSLKDEVKAHGQFLVGEYEVVEEVKPMIVSVETSTGTEENVNTKEVVKKIRPSRKKKVNEETTVVNKTEQIATIQPIEVVVSNEQIISHNEENIITPKSIESIPPKGNAKKRWQREQEALKRLELKSQGILKQEILTIENVTAWIKGGRSYAVIARESVGCTEEEVSKFCKKHNITP